jgi:hypothetical protein
MCHYQWAYRFLLLLKNTTTHYDSPAESEPCDRARLRTLGPTRSDASNMSVQTSLEEDSESLNTGWAGLGRAVEWHGEGEPEQAAVFLNRTRCHARRLIT